MTQTPLPPASKSATFPPAFCFLWKIKKIKKQKRIDATFFRLTLARENESNADVFCCFFFRFVLLRVCVLQDTFCERQRGEERRGKRSENKERKEMTSRREQVIICHMIRTIICK